MELAGPTRSWTKDENGKFIGYRLHTWRTTEVWAKSLCAASKVSNYHNGMARVDVTPPKFVWRCVHLALYLVVAILMTIVEHRTVHVTRREVSSTAAVQISHAGT